MGQNHTSQQIKDNYQIKNVRDDGSVMLQHNKTHDQFLLRNICSNIQEEVKGFQQILLKRQKIKSPHLLELVKIQSKQQKGVCSIIHKIYLLIEYPFKNLKQQIQQKKAQGTRKSNKTGLNQPKNPFGEAELWSILYSCCVGLNTIYENKLAHQSLNSNQIYITKNGLIKISDPLLLGLQKNYIRVLRNDSQQVYVSPEIMNFLDDCTFSFYDKQKADVFTLGAIILQAAILKDLNIYDYHRKKPNLQVIPKHLAEVKQNYSAELYDVLCSMMQLHAKMRPTLSDIINKIEQDNTLADETQHNDINNHTTQSTFNQVNSKNQHSSLQHTPNNYHNYASGHSSSNFSHVQPFHISTNQHYNSQPQTSKYQPPMISSQNNSMINFSQNNRLMNHQNYQTSNQLNNEFKKYENHNENKDNSTNNQPPTVQFPSFNRKNQNNNQFINSNNNSFLNSKDKQGFPRNQTLPYLHQYTQPQPQQHQNQQIFFINNSNLFPKYNQYPQQQQQHHAQYNQFSYLNKQQPQRYNCNKPFQSSITVPANQNNNTQKNYDNKHVVSNNYQMQPTRDMQKQNIIQASHSCSNIISFQNSKHFQRNENQVKINPPPQRSPGGQQNKKKIPANSNNQSPVINLENNITKIKQFQTKTNTKPHSVQKQPQVENRINSSINQLQYKTLILHQGGKYSGYMKNGRKHGKGKLQFKDGGFYQGDWQDDKMQGFGRLHYENGLIAYEGQWVNDQFYGKGKVFNDRPQKILGAFNYYDFADLGDKWIYYEGQFKSDSKDGVGKLKLSNGQLFHGNFIQDTIQGQGTFYNIKGQAISGRWIDNILVSDHQ